MWFLLFFFFSSRRRHTRYWRDWSSDVCSSDLDVVIAQESVDHILVFAQVRHDAELYLRVVGREEQAILVGDECFAYLLAVLVADGDVLQVRVARAEASRSGDRLVERCMHPSRSEERRVGK